MYWTQISEFKKRLREMTLNYQDETGLWSNHQMQDDLINIMVDFNQMGVWENCDWESVTAEMKLKNYSSKDANDQDNLMSELRIRWIGIFVSIVMNIIYYYHYQALFIITL
jgi:hypothetical protein